jgi:hypothetical protein
MIAQVNSKKKLDPEKLLPFAWDKECTNPKAKPKEATQEEIHDLRERAKKIERKNNV